ncbi:sialin isoform X2 [Procambarus clarkii]|uniref:sialin isoform X2 n=1 Tax=Procambarus clarkii TaxID=6728 RepID=UPI0037421554
MSCEPQGEATPAPYRATTVPLTLTMAPPSSTTGNTADSDESISVDSEGLEVVRKEVWVVNESIGLVCEEPDVANQIQGIANQDPCVADQGMSVTNKVLDIANDGLSVVSEELGAVSEELGVVNDGFISEDEEWVEVGGADGGRLRRERQGAVRVVFKMAARGSKEPKITITTPVNSPFTLSTDTPPRGGWWGARHTLAMMGFLGLAVSHALRVTLSIAVLAMVARRPADNFTLQEPPDACPLPEDWNDGELTEMTGESDWDEVGEGLVLGVVYWGYLFTSFLEVRVVRLLGGRLVFGMSVVLASFTTLLVPYSAHISRGTFVALRVLIGGYQGLAYPSLSHMLHVWVSPRERCTFLAFVVTGVPLGIAACLSTSGVLIESGFLGGWPSVFYLFGALGLLWSAPWFLLVHDRPELHPNVSSSELHYTQTHTNSVNKYEVERISWTEVMKSGQFWATMSASLGTSFTFMVFWSGLPSYLSTVHHFHIKNNGLMCALPYLVMGVSSLSWVWLRHLLAGNWLSTRAHHRLSIFIGTYGPAVALAVMCFVGCNWKMTVGLVCVIMGCLGISFNSGLAYQDSPPSMYGTSTLFFVNNVGAVAGILAPAVIGFLTQHNPSPGTWKAVFVVTTAIAFISASLCTVLGLIKLQSWNDPKAQDMERSPQQPLAPHQLSGEG